MAKKKKTFSQKLKWKILAICTVVFLLFTAYLDFTIRSTFSDKKWAIPSTVYARPLELYQGAELSVKDLKVELGLLGYQFVSRVKQPGQASIDRNSVTMYTPGFQFSDYAEPPRTIELKIKQNQIKQLHTSDNNDLIRLEPVLIGGIYPGHNEDRLLVKLEEVPLTLQQMIIASEDDSFYEHFGLSFRGIARAMIANIKGGSISQGASTLTQQLVKNFYLSSERTYTRKAQEALMAMLLEWHFTKEDILEGYINEIYLGQDGPRAIHGFGLASQYYFRQPLSELRLDQQALLVALVRGANYYNPWRNPERALKRRNLILDLAVKKEFLTANSITKAKQQPLSMGDRDSIEIKRYPAYLDLVRRQLQRDYKHEDLSSNGLTIFTHFDPLVQSSAEDSLSKAIKKHQSKGLSDKLEGAVVITKPNTGAVLAIVGGKNARFAGFNRAIDARRQVGSLLKPAVYLTAIEQPEQYSLASVISDESYTFTQQNGEQWSPKNYDKLDHGEVLLYKALANSYNQSTARLGNTIGLENIVSTIHKLGVEQNLSPLPSLTLGAVGMVPLEVAQMYQTLSADGFYTPLLAINAVMDTNGSVLSRYPLAVEQRFDTASIYMLRHALQAATHEGTAKALTWLMPDFAVAGKTGTTNDLRDSWFAGFSGDMMAVVWMGRDDNANTGLTGSSGALRVWADIVSKRSRLPIQNLPPENVEIAWVDRDTGQGSQESCSNAIPLPFKTGFAPDEEIRCNQGIEKVIDWFQDLIKQ